ncbi:MAG TPA: serine/threonine phosphatase [Nostocaceae cyanobacterium]|nr:serine/threonine phosphatase [Nostocaceae cyanobacterium]
MLICPQCKFENPNSNKFCQSCGTSLTHKTCQQCGASVVLNAQFCHECGAECGPIWWAIIAQTVPMARVGEAKTQENASTGESNLAGWRPTVGSVRSPYVAGSYLDPQQRYQLLTDLPEKETIAANVEVKVRVLDCQPYQISPIEAMLENESPGLMESLGKNGIPQLAKAYIQLQSEIQPGIPLIHDAWEQDNMQVVLLDDRTNWRLLLDVWQDDTTSPLQILHWCYQMTQLWAILELVNCRQSLLELSNLRLDEDQTLALQRLYTDPLPNEYVPPITLKALGRVWQTLFRQSQKTQFGLIVQMLEDLETDKIETLAQLRSRLETIASELETPPVINYSSVTDTDSAATILQSDYGEDTIGKNDDTPTMVLSMQLSSLEDAGRTDVGRQRRHNEDYFGIEAKIQKLEYPKSRVLQARGLYILCDGMGGHAGGEIASELAVNTLRQYFQDYWVTNQLPTEKEIHTAISLANQTIYTVNQQEGRSGVGRMGTTLVMLLLQENQAVVAHVGDSRLYRLTRKRGLEQVTVDHEVGQREIKRGVEPSLAYARSDAYQLTQALGPRDESAIEPDVEFFEINEDTLLLLASDGLSDNDLLETHWQTHLEPLLSSSTSLESGVNNLIDLANQYNGHDNITAILIRVKVRPNQESFQ